MPPLLSSNSVNPFPWQPNYYHQKSRRLSGYSNSDSAAAAAALGSDSAAKEETLPLFFFFCFFFSLEFHSLLCPTLFCLSSAVLLAVAVLIVLTVFSGIVSE